MLNRLLKLIGFCWLVLSCWWWCVLLVSWCIVCVLLRCWLICVFFFSGLLFW